MNDLPGWVQIWRKAISHTLTLNGLEALRGALVRDDPELALGESLTVWPHHFLGDKPVAPERACSIGYAEWKSRGLATNEQVINQFGRDLDSIAEKLESKTAMLDFTDWHDNGDRQKIRRELLIEVERSLAERLSAEATQSQ